MTNGKATRGERARREVKAIDWSTDEELTSDNSETPRVTTRRAWTDYCSKGRSSQSDEDNNNSMFI